MPYIDAFLLPVPKKNVDAYRRIAKKASKVWLDHGALEYRECVGDDLNFAGDMSVSFLSLNNFKKNETNKAKTIPKLYRPKSTIP